MEIKHPSPPLGLLLRLLDQRFSSLCAARLEKISLSLSEMTTLSMIHGNPGVRVTDLSESLWIKAPNVSKIINRLEDGGFIRREPNREDGRAVSMSLTPKGVRAVDYGRKVAQDVEREALHGLGAVDAEQFRAFVVTALANLGPEGADTARSSRQLLLT
jgi:MarR family transcriptional regulator for hemolysin